MQFKNPFANHVNQETPHTVGDLGGRRSIEEIREDMQRAKPKYDICEEPKSTLPEKDHSLEKQQSRIDCIKTIERGMK